MIIIILFATFVSLFFQSTQYSLSESFAEGFEDKEKSKEKDDMSNEDEEEEEKDVKGKKKSKKEGYKYSFQGEEPDVSSNDDKDLGKDSDAPPTTKTAKLKQDMEQYFEIQKELLSVLEKAEPLQQKAEAFKERFNTKKQS
jgi:hypothetical protein